MAEVDFSHAKIEPATTAWENFINPTSVAYVTLSAASGFIYNSSATTIGNISATKLVDAQKQLVYQYQGTFSASGTEFYTTTGQAHSAWRVYNISFNSGDTFIFQVKADLICQ